MFVTSRVVAERPDMDDDGLSHWEDAIDVDDSDLASLLNPHIPPSNNPIIYSPALARPLRRCSQSLNPNPNPLSQSLIDSSHSRKKTASRSLIPGPAGAVQAAMHRRSSAAAAPRSPLLNSQERIVLQEEEEDGDFKLNPWLSAVSFLGRDFESRTPIGSIKNRKSAADKIPKMVGVVKSCVPNGLGDLFITLKDPTGMIGASILRNVLKESNIGRDISFGCAVILKQVAVFCPGHSACYLNVTTNNMVKLISKYCGPPKKQMVPSSEAACRAFDDQMEDGPDSEKKLHSPRRREESVAGNTMSLPYNNTAGDSNSSLGTNISSSIAAKLDHRAISTKNMVDKPDHISNTTANMVDEPDRRVYATKNMASKTTLETNNKTNVTTNLAADAGDAKKTISKVSVAQWIDEQLLELFADY